MAYQALARVEVTRFNAWHGVTDRLHHKVAAERKMEWFEVRSFQEHLEELETFFVDMAAAEDHLRASGLRFALGLLSAEKGLAAINLFVEEFTRLKRVAIVTDKALASELQLVETEGKLIEQVSLIALRLKMTQARRRPPVSVLVADAMRIIPLLSSFVSKRSPFGEERISLHRTIIHLGRLRSVTKILEEILLRRDLDDNDVMKPSNVDKARVIQLLDDAISELESSNALSTTRRAQIVEYLQEAKREIVSARPSWSKIVGALVIIAAVTSGVADAPNAVKNVRAAIEHILGTSIEKAQKNTLPPPSTPAPYSPPVEI